MSERNKPRGITLSGNWKMNHTQKESESFFGELTNQKIDLDQLKVNLKSNQLKLSVFPAMTSMETAVKIRSGWTRDIQIGCQNVHWKDEGAFTGEVSTSMLDEIKVDLALVAHSERRQYFGETVESSRERIAHLLEKKFDIIFCIGETQKERDAGQTENVLRDQLRSIEGFELDGDHFAIAYEPVWAIGTGVTATPEQAEESHQFVRKVLWDHFGMEKAGTISLLYGGSVKDSNIDELLQCPNVDGALVGGASLKADHYCRLINSALKHLS